MALVIKGAGGGVRVGVRAATIGRCRNSGGIETLDFGGSLGGGSRVLFLLAGTPGAKVSVMVWVDSAAEGRSILGSVGSGPSLSNTVKSTITLGRFDPGA
jgi:hypothetical protein